jgi:hypothetical protein
MDAREELPPRLTTAERERITAAIKDLGINEVVRRLWMSRSPLENALAGRGHYGTVLVIREGLGRL